MLELSLKNKIALITGASRGIGYAIAENLANQGAFVVISSSKEDVCQEVARKLSEIYGVKTLGIAGDIKNPNDVQSIVKKAEETFGGIDILVNNAGIAKDNLVLRLSQEDWDSVLQTNLNSVFQFTKCVLRPMLKKRWGRIINISSVIGVMGNAGQANYAASKAGMIGFTKSVAKEYAPKGITCNAIAPGFIQTDMTQSLPAEYIDTIIANIPQKQLGQAADVANIVSFLASELSGYITGQVIHVDGGLVM